MTWPFLENGHIALFIEIVPVDDLRDIGYDVRLFLNKVNGPEGEGDLDTWYRLPADGVVTTTEPRCGPDPSVEPGGPCQEWVFDFPDGLEAGTYQVWVEWVAPCAVWFEADVCDSPARPVSFLAVGSEIGVLGEGYRKSHTASPEWPFDPWTEAQPLPMP